VTDIGEISRLRPLRKAQLKLSFEALVWRKVIPKGFAKVFVTDDCIKPVFVTFWGFY
jgi:hypothetical protein